MNDAYAIAEVIGRLPGFVVEVCGLYVSKTKDGKYHVVNENTKEETMFESQWAAANHFMLRRRELKLGYDLAQVEP